MNILEEIKQAYNNWKYLGTCHCCECRVKISRKQASKSLFCEPCQTYFQNR